MFLELGLKNEYGAPGAQQRLFPKPTNICVIQLASGDVDSTSGKHMTTPTQTCHPVCVCVSVCVCHPVLYEYDRPVFFSPAASRRSVGD